MRAIELLNCGLQANQVEENGTKFINVKIDENNSITYKGTKTVMSEEIFFHRERCTTKKGSFDCYSKECTKLDGIVKKACDLYASKNVKIKNICDCSFDFEYIDKVYKLLKRNGYYKATDSMSGKGYQNRRLNIEKYNGKYGKGFIIHTPDNRKGKGYDCHRIEYWVK